MCVDWLTEEHFDGAEVSLIRAHVGRRIHSPTYTQHLQSDLHFKTSSTSLHKKQSLK